MTFGTNRRINQRDLILLEFPFDDKIESKLRPVLVISNDKYNSGSSNYIVLPLTTNLAETEYDLLINPKDLEKGYLRETSKIRTDKLFCAHKSTVLRKFGTLKLEIFSKIHSKTLSCIN